MFNALLHLFNTATVTVPCLTCGSGRFKNPQGMRYSSRSLTRIFSLHSVDHCFHAFEIIRRWLLYLSLCFFRWISVVHHIFDLGGLCLGLRPWHGHLSFLWIVLVTLSTRWVLSWRSPPSLLLLVRVAVLRHVPSFLAVETFPFFIEVGTFLWREPCDLNSVYIHCIWVPWSRMAKVSPWLGARVQDSSEEVLPRTDVSFSTAPSPGRCLDEAASFYFLL
jgi:hypothetical protein